MPPPSEVAPSLRSVLFGQTALAERYSDAVVPSSYPGEEALTESAASLRTAEVLTTRGCARDALAQIGYGPIAILRDLHGAPLWPKGVVGSMTHCTGYRAAAVARELDMETIGIDAEPNEPLPQEVVDDVASLDELELLEELYRFDARASWDRLLFSAKESFFKAWYPIRHTWLDFLDVHVGFYPARTAFEAMASTENGRVLFTGRYVITPSHVLTSIQVHR